MGASNEGLQNIFEFLTKEAKDNEPIKEKRKK
jgi:hypothetical protein